jgi:hypothetical protein
MFICVMSVLGSLVLQYENHSTFYSDLLLYEFIFLLPCAKVGASLFSTHVQYKTQSWEQYLVWWVHMYVKSCIHQRADDASTCRMIYQDCRFLEYVYDSSNTLTKPLLTPLEPNPPTKPYLPAGSALLWVHLRQRKHRDEVETPWAF